MSEEIEELLIKTEGKNKEDALEAMIMLSKIYAYGFYGAKKDLEQAEFWSQKARELKQKLPHKDNSEPYDIFKRAKEFKQSLLKTENIKIDKTFTTRFDNIQRNLKFVNTKDIANDKQLSTDRFNNIQLNLKFVSIKNNNKN